MSALICETKGCNRDFETVCAHCHASFCSKHYVTHIKVANNDLVPLADELNSMINKIQYTNPIHQALHQLEKSRETSHHNIDTIYDEKKRQLQFEVDIKKEMQLNKLLELNQKVSKLISDGNASFKQIENLKRDFQEVQKQYKKFEKANFIRSNFEPNQLKTIVSNKEYFTGDDGTLLSYEHQVKLNEFYGKKTQKWELIYKGTRDSFTSGAFHRHCDHRGPTMTIIQSKSGGYLFGGYTSVSWRSSQGYVEDSYEPFLFTLTNPHGIPPTKYPVIEERYAIFNKKECGPTFGCGHDLYVCDDSKISTGSYIYFPWSYSDRTNRGSETFTGTKYFQTNDIEVYRLIEN
ncbi:unnamed protein product [Adineta steineri]|uniref:TLDc domain-containing protein n=1 Tax=Adineta steineri TaxID=433720 RepID=A0A819ECJ4_9BILA|nr:unnamed protein product [Adineta steineri]CAF3848434.1 unnamed protein product [Adineta steineri]